MKKPRLSSETKRNLNRYCGWAFFGLVPLNFTLSLLFAFKYSQEVPGLMASSLLINLAFCVLFGALGYLFYGGILLDLIFVTDDATASVAQTAVPAQAAPQAQVSQPPPRPVPQPQPAQYRPPFSGSRPGGIPPMATPPPMALPAMNAPMPGELPKNPYPEEFPDDDEQPLEPKQGPFSGMGGAGAGGPDQQ